MPKYIVAGTATFSSTTNRDAAVSRMNTALSPYTGIIQDITTTVTTGIKNTTTTTVAVSIEVVDEAQANDVARDIYGAWTSSNRFTTGYLSVSVVP